MIAEPLTDTHLLELNQQGLIPGPYEDEATFIDRASRCQHLKESIVTELKENIPFVQEELCSEALEQKAFATTRQLYDIAPSWIPVFFSNRQLRIWHGGCAWIFQLEQDSPPMAFLQLRREFATQDKFMGLYHRDELMAHELSHVGRMAFEEPRFEEMFAYRSATSTFRRWFGPILQSSHEALILLGLLLLVLVVDVVAVTQGAPYALAAVQGWKILPLGYLAYLIVRLQNRHRIFNQCRSQLIALFGDAHIADSVMYRLTDAEIEALGRKSTQEIQNYAQEQSGQSLRWHLLQVAYFLKETTIE